MKISGVIVALLLILWSGAQVKAETYTVFMKNRAFNPAQLPIKVGDTVQWINDDEDVHLVISGKDLNDPAKGKPLDSGTLLPKQTFSYTFSTPGVYPYMCVIHWSLQSITGMAGMIGEVVVETDDRAERR
ncbi:MAG: plastocyanin/azurin family copper-binding protein [Nitrospirota bacterium]